jgi:hypothetical protein
MECSRKMCRYRGAISAVPQAVKCSLPKNFTVLILRCFQMFPDVSRPALWPEDLGSFRFPIPPVSLQYPGTLVFRSLVGMTKPRHFKWLYDGQV